MTRWCRQYVERPELPTDLLPSQRLTEAQKREIITALDRLTDREEKFVWEYLRCRCFAKAARAAGYSEAIALHHAERVVGKGVIRAALQLISEVIAGMQWSQLEERRALLTKQHRVTMGRFFEMKNGSPELRQDVDLEEPGLKKLKVLKRVDKEGGETTETTVELHDPLGPVQELNKLDGAYPKKDDQGDTDSFTLIIYNPRQAMKPMKIIDADATELPAKRGKER